MAEDRGAGPPPYKWWRIESKSVDGRGEFTFLEEAVEPSLAVGDRHEVRERGTFEVTAVELQRKNG